MLKREVGFRKIPYSILLLFSIFVLVGWVGNANGSVYATYYANDYNILNGTYLSGSVPASVETVDSDYFIVGSSSSATSTSAYNPSGYSLLGSTSWVSGSISNLMSNDSVYMVFRSYGSATTDTSYNPSGYSLLGSTALVDGTTSNLTANDGSYMIFRSYATGASSTEYAHVETETIGGTNYYKLLVDPADTSGTTLTVDAATTGRKLFGKFVYPLSGVSSIPAGTWTIYYRAYRDASAILVVHCDVDILIRMANDTIRQTIAIDVANTTDLGDSWATVSGTYSWAAYTVVDQTDYLEVDFYAHVTTAVALKNAYLRIDDDTLATADQTRAVTTIPANFISEVEFTGSSNLYDWAQIDWSVDSAWTVSSVSVTIQLYNYTLGDYPTSGGGYLSYTSSSSANTDEIKSQTISTNPEDFRNATGYWKIKIKGETSPSAQFDFNADWIEFKPRHFSEWTSEVEFSGTSNTYIWTQLNWTVESAWTVGSVSVTIQLYNYTLGDYSLGGNGYIAYTSSSTPDTDETKYQVITTNSEDFRNATGWWKIKVKGLKTTTTQFDFKADWVEFKPTYYSEYTVSTEFLFSSMTTNTPTQLNFTVVSQCNISSVSVTIQVWNYSSSAYVTSGEAYLEYTSSGTNETKTLSINTNPQFYVSNGNAKIKITGVLATTTQYQQEMNQVELLYSYAAVPPAASFTFVPESPVVNESIVFNASASYDEDGTIVSYEWDFGDGNVTTVSVSAITHAYTTYGNFTVSLTIQDSEGLTDLETKTIKVYAPPVADFTSTPVSPIVNETINFDASASYDPDGSIVSYFWTFGDGTNGTGKTTTYTYTNLGTYNVTLTVTDNDAYINSTGRTVTVYIHDVAVISVIASATDVVSGQVVNVTVVVKNNGSISETFNVSLFYNETVVETKTVTNLAPGDQKTLEFIWNTTGVTEASYRIRAVADSVSGEMDTKNNAFTGTIIKVSIQTSSPPFNWFSALLYMLLVLFGLLFLFALKLQRKKKTKPHIEKKTDTFSQQFGMTHQQMIGKKMLLEIDPTSDYHKAISSFVSEAKNSDGLLFILTNKNSTLHSAFSGDANVRFLLLTSKTSSPHQINEKETFLPASDLSVLLDACAGFQKVETEKTVNLIFDNLSDIILRCGFERTYKFIRLLLEAISSPKTIVLFLFNPMAHEPVISSSIRGLFHIKLAYAKSGPKVGTL